MKQKPTLIVLMVSWCMRCTMTPAASDLKIKMWEQQCMQIFWSYETLRHQRYKKIYLFFVMLFFFSIQKKKKDFQVFQRQFLWVHTTHHGGDTTDWLHAWAPVIFCNSGICKSTDRKGGWIFNMTYHTKKLQLGIDMNVRIQFDFYS